MYIYTPLCRYWIALYRHVLVFIVPHMDIELEDNKQFISNIPRKFKKKLLWSQAQSSDIYIFSLQGQQTYCFCKFIYLL